MKEYIVKINGLEEEWFENDQLIKRITYYSNNQKKTENNYLNNKLSCEDGPALKKWYKNGQKEYEQYFVNNTNHREDGPSFLSWYKNGQKEYEEYYLDDKLHRENGPALQKWNKNGQKKCEEYYLNGKEVSKEYFLKPKNTIKIGEKDVSEETILLALKNYFGN